MLCSNFLLDSGFMLVFLLICVVVSMIFFTLFERKLLSVVQKRKGPKKVGYMGMLKPLSDSLKMVLKKMFYSHFTFMVLFKSIPVLMAFFFVILWVFFPYSFLKKSFVFSSLFFYCVSTVLSLAMVATSFTSNKKYSLLGSFRLSGKMITFEVGVIFILLVFLSSVFSYDLFFLYSKNKFFIIFFPVMFVVWFMFILLETKRTPFDFAEGESELVSGYNVEYGGLTFAMFYLTEYGKMMLLSFLTSIIWL